jgi:protease-4
MPVETARSLADGSIYSGRQALKLKLIDAVGGDEEARAWLATKNVPKDLPMNEWKPDEPFFSIFQTHALAGVLRLLGIDPNAAAFLPERLAVDGLLLVWQAPLFARSDR